MLTLTDPCTERKAVFLGQLSLGQFCPPHPVGRAGQHTRKNLGQQKLPASSCLGGMAGDSGKVPQRSRVDCAASGLRGVSSDHFRGAADLPS